MKLAQALILRADATRRVAELRARLKRNAKVQQGDDPAEDPAALVKELNRVLSELQVLIQRINRTNAATQFAEGQSLTDALAQRDILKLKRAAILDLVEASSIKQDRYSKSEVKFKSTVDAADLQKQADRLAKEHRELDERIQQLNWSTDVVE